MTVPDPVEHYLRSLVARCDDVPLVDELTAVDLGTPCGTASIARAALRQLLDKRGDVIAADLRRELAEDDWLVRCRIRQAGLDVHGRGSIDWTRIHDVVQARAAYRDRWGGGVLMGGRSPLRQALDSVIAAGAANGLSMKEITVVAP